MGFFKGFVPLKLLAHTLTMSELPSERAQRQRSAVPRTPSASHPLSRAAGQPVASASTAHCTASTHPAQATA